MMDLDRYLAAPTFPAYLTTVEKNHDLWHGLWNRAALPAELASRAKELEGRWHLLALSEDWCGDAVNILPWVARMAEAAPSAQLRVLGRDDNLDLMDAHLTDGRSRSIPVVIIYDEDFQEVDWWGPRPSELQLWVKEKGLELPPEERYAEVRRRYARDRGRSIVEELMALLEIGAPAHAGPHSPSPL
jgi:hypothetical protein